MTVNSVRIRGDHVTPDTERATTTKEINERDPDRRHQRRRLRTACPSWTRAEIDEMKFICVDLRDAEITADLRSCRRNGQGER